MTYLCYILRTKWLEGEGSCICVGRHCLGVIYLNFPSSSSRTEPNRDLQGDAQSPLGEEVAQSRFDLGENAPARSWSRSRPSIKIAFGLGSGVPNRAEHRARSVHSQAWELEDS